MQIKLCVPISITSINYTMKHCKFSLIAAEVKALKHVWCIGDKFLFNLHHIISESRNKPGQGIPYLHTQYNFTAWYTNPLSDVEPTVVHIFNALAEVLNDKKQFHLPKYLIVIPDRDILDSLNIWDYSVKASIQCNFFSSGCSKLSPKLSCHGVTTWNVNIEVQFHLTLLESSFGSKW